jgi:hypothetical protein
MPPIAQGFPKAREMKSTAHGRARGRVHRAQSSSMSLFVSAISWDLPIVNVVLLACWPKGWMAGHGDGGGVSLPTRGITMTEYFTSDHELPISERDLPDAEPDVHRNGKTKDG